ncbi:MFS transporter [Oryzobacter sp. R7]|uniref:MFS transporter n=1 Tax=Oryzobacter faecalis TaxID=3388656 RepID=UPI00398CAEDB
MTAPLTAREAERRLYLLTVTRWFPVGLVVGILILVQTGRGLSITQAATLGSITGLTIFLLELPTSGFADAVGRRPVYVAAGVLNVVAGFGLAVAQTFLAFAVVAVLTGAFRALDSGPLEAWFVDTVHAERPGADVDQQLARTGSLLGGSIAVGALLSGALVWGDPAARLGHPGHALDTAVWVFAVLNVVHLVASAVLVREPRAAAGSRRERFAVALHEARRTPAVVGSGVRLLRVKRVLLALVAVELFWSVGMVVFEALMPLRLEELLGSAKEAGVVLGPVAAAGWGIFAAGSWLAGLASARVGVAGAAMLARALNALGAVVMGLAAGPVALVVAYLFTYSMHGMNGAPHSALLHREAEAGNRATVLSMNSMVAFLAFAVAAPLVGALADTAGLQTAMVVGGAWSLLGVLLYLPARRHERARAAEPAPV